MFYPEELIEEIRYQNDIVEVVKEYVHLRESGSNHFGLCPFHNEKSPSFCVSSDKQMFYCFGCGAGGNVISFIMQIENYNFVEAIKHLAQRARIDLPEPEYSEEYKLKAKLKQDLLDIHKIAAKYYYANLHSIRGQAGLKYITERKIATKYQKSFGLGFSSYSRNDLYKYLLNKGYSNEVISKTGLVIPEKNKDGFFDRFGNRLMFPIFDIHNNVIGFGGRIIGQGEPKYLNSPDTILFDKSRNLYGFNIARKSKRDYIILVEGYMDTIALHQAGFDNAAASLGTAFNIEHARLIKKYKKEVVVLYDSDEAGTNAILRAIPILKKAGLDIRVLQVTDAKDPDEYLKKYGSEQFEKLILTAQSYIDFQMNYVHKKYNVEDTQQQIKLTQELALIISRLDNAIEIEAYAKKASQISGISLEAITSELYKIINKNNSEAEKAILKPKKEISNKIISKSEIKEKKDNAQGLENAQKEILRLIYENEKIYLKVKDYLQPCNFKETYFQRLAEILYKHKETKKEISTAEIIDYFEDTEQRNIISSIFFKDEQEYSSSKLLEKAINDQVKLILSNYITETINKLEDIEKIQKLIMDRQNLNNLNIRLTDG